VAGFVDIYGSLWRKQYVVVSVKEAGFMLPCMHITSSKCHEITLSYYFTVHFKTDVTKRTCVINTWNIVSPQFTLLS
jgi:hypothetical protein